MLDVTIQNDGKIKFQSECSNTKEMKFNVNLLLGDALESVGCVCKIIKK